MAKYSDPKFIGKIQPDEIPLEPVAPQKTSGLEMAGTAASGLTDAIQKFYAQKIEDAEKQAKIGLMEAQAEKAKSDAVKAKQDVQASADKNAALKSFMGGSEGTGGSDILMPHQNPDAAVPSTEIPIPQGVDKKQSRAVETDIEADPIYQNAVKAANFSLHIDKSMSPTDYTKEITKARKEVGKNHVTTEFLNQLDASQPQNYEDASKILRSIPGATKYLDRGDQEELLKSFERQSALDKAKAAADREERTAKAAERTADRADKQFAETQKQHGIENEERIVNNIRNYTKDNNELIDMRGQLDDVKGIINQYPGKKIPVGALNALKGRLNLEDETDVFTAIYNAFFSNDPNIKKRQEVQRALSSGEVQAAMKDPKFAKLISTYGSFVNSTLHKLSGAAITPSEFSRLKVDFGLDPFASPEEFMNALDAQGSRIDRLLERSKGGLTPEARSRVESMDATGSSSPTPWTDVGGIKIRKKQ